MIYNNKELLKISIVSLILSLFFLLISYLFTMKGIYIQFGTPAKGINHQFLNGLFIITTVVSGVYLINYKQKDKVIRGIVIGIGSFIFALVLLNGLEYYDAEYTTFSSPDSQESFLIIETGHGEIYQLSNSGLFMTHLTNIRTDDGYKPFLNGAYQLEWKEPNELLIKYVFDYMEPNNFQEVTVTYKFK
ncbi:MULTISPECIES: hypothetical protein [Bacillus]|uniref:Uncharacterized protein n=2 Tax=Bacillus TaxID=1386 RepID=A0A0M4FJX6_9BACI|nr:MULTISPECIES: hypothetical protein [Bacillus]ALC83511.1 hypothetical protein AM592_19710 [Bacillus gobiensis]MBP1082485.1 hypothetical protein [Bacillus capparidis]MED1097278.1 hypothetical protein [Bacillus capparidis]